MLTRLREVSRTHAHVVIVADGGVVDRDSSRHQVLVGRPHALANCGQAESSFLVQVELIGSLTPVARFCSQKLLLLNGR
eukprot:SAG11_NODE_4804_length_1761_cov_1.308664_3_plen_79_part_00